MIRYLRDLAPALMPNIGLLALLLFAALKTV